MLSDVSGRVTGKGVGYWERGGKDEVRSVTGGTTKIYVNDEDRVPET